MDNPAALKFDSSIQAVTVFGDRARVTRRGRIQVGAGSWELELKNLPMRLIEESVRVAGTGQGVRISGIQTSLEQVIEAPEENVAALEKELDGLTESDEELRDEDASLGARLKMLESLSRNGAESLAKGIAYGKAGVDTIQALADYCSREQDAFQKRKREIAKRRGELAKQIAAVQARMNALQQPAPQQRRAISIAVDAGVDTEVSLEISYLVTGASWTPQYDLRLLGDKVQATYLAGVKQSTGEDWGGVELSLSTARPAVTKTVPELKPWYLNVYTPPPPPAPRMAMAPAPAPPPGGAGPGEFTRMFSTASSMPAPAPPPPVHFDEAEVEATGSAVTYRIAKPVKIPSDGSPHRALIAMLDFPAALDYITAPKIAGEAYLRATVTNNSSLILLPGAANVFHGDEFTGTTRLENTAPREEFELQLGVDDFVKVERELVERDVSKTFIGKNRRVSYLWRIKLQNLRETPAKVTVLDQLPHPRREEIKVKAGEMSPKPLEQSELGLLEWELTLAPQQKSEIRFGYLIEYPGDWQITGLVD